jgi:hypothetical protein
MKIRYAITAAAVVSLAACAQTPTAPIADQAPAGPSFDGGHVFGSGSRDGGGYLGSGSYVEDGAETTTTSTVEGDSTGRGGYMFGSGS